MNNSVNKILQNIMATAALAADEAKTAVRTAGRAVAEKYDTVKLAVELSRLNDEQEDVFSDIGRMLFLMYTGAVKNAVMSDEGEKSPQQVIDALLVSAEQLQQQMDVLGEKLSECSGEKVCPGCGRTCGAQDAFCAVCGTRLEADAREPEPGDGEAAPEAGQPGEEQAPGEPEA